METMQASYANGLAEFRRRAGLRYKDLDAGYFVLHEEVRGVICAICAEREHFTVRRPLETDGYQGARWTIATCDYCDFSFRILVHN